MSESDDEELRDIGVSSKVSTRFMFDVTDKEAEAGMSINTDHPGERSFQGIIRLTLQAQLKRGNRVRLNDEQVGMLFRVMREDRGIFGKGVRACLGRAFFECLGPEQMTQIVEGKSEEYVENHLRHVSAGGVRARRKMMDPEKETPLEKSIRESKGK